MGDVDRLRRKVRELAKELEYERRKRAQAEVVVHTQKHVLDALADKVASVSCGFSFDVGRGVQDATAPE